MANLDMPIPVVRVIQLGTHLGTQLARLLLACNRRINTVEVLNQAVNPQSHGSRDSAGTERRKEGEYPRALEQREN